METYSGANKERSPWLTYARATTSPEDIATFLELQKSVDEVGVYSAMITDEEVREEIENCVVYFVKRGERVIGAVTYEMKAPNHAYLSGLVVKPEFQGQGIGREATKKVLAELEDVPFIDLVVHPNNARAIALYESLGFEKGERKENYYDDGEPRVVMALRR